MPIIRKEVSVAANSTVNLLEGSIYEFLPWNATMRAGVTAAATGIQVTINSGSDTILEESPAEILARFPVIPDEMDIEDVAAAGERLVFKARNTTGAAIIVRVLVQLFPA